MAEQSFVIYEPPRPSRDLIERAEELVFVKDGFSFWAMLAPPLWMIYHRLWRAVLGFIAAVLLLQGLGWLFGLGEQGTGLLLLVASLCFGFLANDLRRWFLEKQGYHMIGTLAAPSQIACERRFFASWPPLTTRLQKEDAAL